MSMIWDYQSQGYWTIVLEGVTLSIEINKSGTFTVMRGTYCVTTTAKTFDEAKKLAFVSCLAGIKAKIESLERFVKSVGQMNDSTVSTGNQTNV